MRYKFNADHPITGNVMAKYGLCVNKHAPITDVEETAIGFLDIPNNQLVINSFLGVNISCILAHATVIVPVINNPYLKVSKLVDAKSKFSNNVIATDHQLNYLLFVEELHNIINIVVGESYFNYFSPIILHYSEISGLVTKICSTKAKRLDTQW